jgi:hypothetical protein
VALLEKRRFLYNHSGDFPQVILIIPSHVPNSDLYIPRIGPHISCSRKGRPIVRIYNSLTDT